MSPSPSAVAPEVRNEARAAATIYATKLARFARELLAVASRPAREKVPEHDFGIAWPDLAPALRRLPALTVIPGGEQVPQYAAVQEIESRVTPFVDELTVLNEESQSLLTPTQRLGARSNKVVEGSNALREAWDPRAEQHFRESLTWEFVKGGPTSVEWHNRYLAEGYADASRFSVTSFDHLVAATNSVPARSALLRSYLAFMRFHLKLNRDVVQQFRQAQLRHPPPEQSWVPIKTYLLPPTYFVGGGALFWLSRGELATGLARDLVRLATQARSASRAPSSAGINPTTGPFVGDTYRAAIIKRFQPPITAKLDFRFSEEVVPQLWMLWRIKELEGTSEVAFQDARRTLDLQTLTSEADNFIDRVIDFVPAFNHIQSATDDYRAAYAVHYETTMAFLSDPAPSLLEPHRKQLFRLINGLDPRHGDYRQRVKRVIKVARQAATLVDSKKHMKAAVTAAIKATRPKEQPAATTAPAAP